VGHRPAMMTEIGRELRHRVFTLAVRRACVAMKGLSPKSYPLLYVWQCAILSP
jgi:hypothetical protein